MLISPLLLQPATMAAPPRAHKTNGTVHVKLRNRRIFPRSSLNKYFGFIKAAAGRRERMLPPAGQTGTRAIGRMSWLFRLAGSLVTSPIRGPETPTLQGLDCPPPVTSPAAQ